MSEMTLSEAQAVISHFGNMGYPNKLQRTALARAAKIVQAAACAAMSRELKGMCHRCCGDGFHRVTESMIAGPCQFCNGTGSSAPLPSSQEQAS